jgi:hypothetical protein
MESISSTLAPGDGALLDARRQHVAALLGELLGVVEPVDAAFPVKDHRRGDYRAGQRAAACLVDAADHVRQGRLEQVHGTG